MENTDLETIAGRLKSLISELGFTTRKFEIECGITKSTLSKAISEKRSMGVDKINLITQRFPEVNAGWLVSGQGKMFLNAKHLNDVVREDGASYNPTSKLMARIISTAVSDPNFEEELLRDLDRIVLNKEKDSK